MTLLVVVNNPKDWPLAVPDVEVVPARAYLTDPAFSDLKGTKVFNLCKSYKYQSLGYYVSLLAAARGHKPMPDIATILGMRSQASLRTTADDLDDIIQRSLKPITGDRFVLSIYFGQNMAQRHLALARKLFDSFPAPLLRATFSRNGDGKWNLLGLRPISGADIPPDHKDFAVQAAKEHFAGRRGGSGRRQHYRYDLAILVNPTEKHGPSDKDALERFVTAAKKLGIRADLITKDDFGSLAEYDALFIRETTAVNHHTFRFSQYAAAEGLVVIDDPESIIRCTNKVYLQELMERHGIRTPQTLIVHKDNLHAVIPKLGLPTVLKQPDSGFSVGVVKVETREELKVQIDKLLSHSEMIVAQQFVPTAFDWRVGILDRKPLFVSKYFMAEGHWQIYQHDDAGDVTGLGGFKTMAVDDAPKVVVSTALKAANLIGDGFYGVDLKETPDGKVMVMEVNDNPNVDHEVEDEILGDQLYLRIMEVFLERIERRKGVRSAVVTPRLGRGDP